MQEPFVQTVAEWNQDQQWKINYKTNWKVEWTAKNDKFSAQYFG